MAPSKTADPQLTAAKRLEVLLREALHVASKARKHRLSLGGSNFYANKLTELRADATNAFRELSARNAGDVAAMAEMVDTVFGTGVVQKHRNQTAMQLVFSLRTTWRDIAPAQPPVDQGLFPLSILEQTNRGYFVRIGRQMNGCYGAGWYDASAVMMRRLLEVSLIEAFENNGIADEIRRPDGNYMDLSDLIQQTLAEPTWTLSRNTRRFLPQLRDLGHMSAHGRYFSARKEDIEDIRQGCRVVVEEMLHHSRLL
jgi:hypothetical protein